MPNNDSNNSLNALNMIQNIINRLNSNSFSLKGWTVSLVVGIFVLSNKDANKVFFLLTYIPIIMFWFLDSYYLKKERLFRNLFDWTRKQSEETIDFDLSISEPHLKTKKTKFACCFFSISEVGFYLPLSILTFVIIVLLTK